MASVVIAAGGTAGHVVPALAVADALRAEGTDVAFLGARNRAEAELVPAAGYEIELLNIRGFDRRNPLRAAAALGLAVRGIGAARRFLRKREAEAVMGGGGYVAGPGGAAAVALGLPLVLTEADRHLGIANRLLARRAARVCLAFPIPGREGERYLVTGRPVPASVLTAKRGPARENFGIGPSERCLLVFGGSQGALSINLAALDAFVDGPERDYHVLHVTGSRDHGLALERLERSGGAERHALFDYVPSLGEALAASDLVLARAGGSIFEIAAAGKPAILVPYPYASADHQGANAAWMAEAGAAVVLDDSRLDGGALLEVVGELFAHPEGLERMAAASAALARPDAAERVAAEILSAVG